MSVPLVTNPLKTNAKRAEKTEEEKQRDQKRAEELVSYRENLEDELIRKLDELKKICLEEAEITGVLPVEIYLTLHPDEPAPKIKRRIGTAFALPEDVFANALTDDKLALLETDIRIQKGIIAATEKMSKDKFINKSLRKKHRRDLQNAHHKLRDLQKGLNKMRISVSKPDVSSLEGSVNSGSAYSLHGMKSWNDETSSQYGLSAKSCPTTPRGSIPDLCDLDERSSNYSRTWNKSPSSASLVHLQPTTTSTTSGTSIATNTSPNDSGIADSSPPSIPSRRNTLSSTRITSPNGKISNSHLYENVGYSSIEPYKSAYRQSNFPTITNFSQKPDIVGRPQNHSLRTSISAHFPRISNPPTSFGAKSHSASHFNNLQSNHQITSAANTQLGRIVRKMSNVPNSTLAPQSSNHRLSMGNPPSVRAPQNQNNRGFSTTSLDRRILRQRQTAGEIDGSPSTSNGSAAPASTKLTTTFPVGTDNDQMASEPIRESGDPRLRSVSQHAGIGFGVPHCTVNPRHHSASRLPAGDWPIFNSIRDPQMEALLSFYRDGIFNKQLAPNSAVNSTPTTRIVPIEQKSGSTQRTNEATMV
ncbi:hypothetical protein FO519_001113 [Halicephalobus sp. NKZ332]|nr:hypothetical protein FO519_001113 [Halicephalobus sp. NKZ332]